MSREKKTPTLTVTGTTSCALQIAIEFVNWQSNLSEEGNTTLDEGLEGVFLRNGSSWKSWWKAGLSPHKCFVLQCRMSKPSTEPQLWRTSVPSLWSCISFQAGDLSWMKWFRLMSWTYHAPFHSPPSQMGALILQYFPWLLVQLISQWCRKGPLCFKEGYWSYKSLEHLVECAWPTPKGNNYSWLFFNVSFLLQHILCS